MAVIKKHSIIILEFFLLLYGSTYKLVSSLVLLCQH